MLQTGQAHSVPRIGLSKDVIGGLRLLLVADTSSTHTHRWAGWFRDRGAAVTVLSPSPEAIEGVRILRFPARRRWYHAIPKVRMALDCRPFRRLIRQLNPQLIHFHFISEGGRAFYWDGIDCPMIGSAWGQDVIFDGRPRRGAIDSLRSMLGRCRFVTATTHQLALATAAYLPAGRPIHVIPFGVDLARFQPRQPSPETGPIVLGFVKHLLPKYGPDVLVEAFALIHRQRPDTRLLAGRGEMRAMLEKRVAQLGLGGVVEMPGRIAHEQVPQVMGRIDIAVMPSVYESETFGVAAIEASACGVPVVASRIGGVPEAVIDGQTGLLVPPRDAVALAQGCLALIDDPARRRALGAAGRRFVRQYYSWPENARQMEEIYRAALCNDLPRRVPVYRPEVPPQLTIPPEVA